MVVTRSRKSVSGGSSCLAAVAFTSSSPSPSGHNIYKAPLRRAKKEKVKSSVKRNNTSNKKSQNSTQNSTIKSSKAKSPNSSLTDSNDFNQYKEHLISLPSDVITGELRCRPSKRNRSPYVGDVWIESEQREAIVHLPNLDMGGKCVPGAKLLLKPARDKKGNLVGNDSVNPKYGTPKCQYIAQLLRVDETDLGYEPAVWCGAHPSLGEKIAEELVSRNLLGPDFPPVQSYQREVRNVGGTDMRADFLIQHVDPTIPPRILEVKTVVDTDYSPSATPDRVKCVFTNEREPYRRTGIFPWGQSNQKGPDGEAVVSARAIKHVRELTRIVQTKPKEYSATVLFIVIRHDAKAFRPNKDACPSFAKYLKVARDAGVQVLAKQVVWAEGEDLGKCFEGDLLEIEWP
jgi:DNA-binding sugar fermentation-stimulating protein